MQLPSKELKDDTGLKLAQQLHQDLKEENEKLQSDVILCREALLYKQQELNQVRKLAEDQKKMLLGQAMELEKLRKGGEIGEKDLFTDKLAILKEEHKRQQEELLNQQEPNNTPITQDVSVPLCVDVSVQFSWVDVKTDYLQGLTVFRTKYFHVEEEKAHPLIWEGFGFELHLPEHTFLLKEECCIRVDAVIGGDFDIPEGVEPVSAIYVISVTTKLRQPSLLKIQHCVDLDKVHPDSGLSFYTASLKESSPPYHFKRVPGGRFDILDKYGELELPVFCAKFIGKDQGGTHSDNSVEGDDSSSSGLDSSIALDTMDDSIMYRGQLFYLYKSLNRWQVKFIVVKNIDAFAEYVAIELRDYEADALVDLVSCVNNIKLEGEPTNVPNGWTVLHHTKPLSISMKRASAFGSEKVVSSPPFCMLTINGKDTVSDSSEELNYPLTLKDCVTVDDHNEPVINIIRTMTKAGDVSLSCASSTTTQQTNGLPLSRTLPDVSRVIASIKEEINKKFAGLKSIFDNSIDVVTAEMFTAGLISSEVKSAEAIIIDFQSGFVFMNSLPEIEQHCSTFFDVLEKLGGPFRIASKSLKQSIKKNVEDKCNTTFSSF